MDIYVGKVKIDEKTWDDFQEIWNKNKGNSLGVYLKNHPDIDKLLDEIIESKPIVSVLFETYSDGFVQGHTDSFLAVTAKSEIDLHGEIRKVKLTSHKDGICFGEIQ